MDSTTRERLQQMLAGFHQKIQDAARTEAQQLQAEQAFVARFLALRDHVIRPVLQDLYDVLDAAGHRCEIIEQTGDPRTTSFPLPYGFVFIALLVFRSDVPVEEYQRIRRQDADGSTFLPQVRFAADVQQQQVMVFVSALVPGVEGSGGPVRSYPLEHMTQDVVEREAVEGIERIFERIRPYHRDMPRS